jgi:hypothetical protein
MSINISAFAGAGAQFSDSNGAPLSGGLIYTYAAGTTTNAVTFTSRTGLTNNTNPIVLDSAGRTPAEIWLTGGSLYKFVLKDSAFVQIGSYDNIPAINDVTTVSNLITVAGTNTLTALGSPAVVAYTAGAQYSFLPQNNNTGAVTINIDTLGAKSITKFGTTPLAANDLIANSFAIVEYDGTQFQLVNAVGNTFDNITVDYIKETTTISATAATGTINYDVATQSVLYYTTNASANWTVNLRGSSAATLNSLMSTGQTITVVFMVTQGATAYYNSALQVDGASVTPKWQSGATPTAGNINSVDAYTYAIVKTANATFTVFATQSKFA